MPHNIDLAPPPSPFDGAAPDLANPTLGVYGWLTSPAGVILVYATGVEIDQDVVRWAAEQCEAALTRRLPGNGTPLIYVHDFSRAVGYTSAGRKMMTEWGVRVRSRIQIVVAVAPQLSPLIRMGLSAAAGALQIAGVRMEIASSLADVVTKLKLGPLGR